MPRVVAATAPGFCVGLVAEGLKAPRGFETLPNGDIVVADMGSWQGARGAIWLLRPADGSYQKTLLFNHLDRPNAVAAAPDGTLYVGLVQRIVRIDVHASRPAMVDVVGGTSSVPPLPGTGRHLLPSLLFGPKGDLFVGVGSASDHCEGPDGQAPDGKSCAEGVGALGRGTIRKYSLQWPAGSVRAWEVYASGLRNSMAIALDPRSGALWQGENGRDAIQAAMPELKNDDELPHDELNAIQRGAHYGWPFCYDDNRVSPEYPTLRCSGYRAPARLLPAHAAPLGMAFYSGGAFPRTFDHSLIVSYHGYRQHGHRIVALLADRSGAPLGKSVDLVIGSRRNGSGFGAPVGVKVGADGSVYFTDDHHGTVMRLYYEGSKN